MFHAGQQYWGRQQQDPAKVPAVDGCFNSRGEDGFILGQRIPQEVGNRNSAAMDEQGAKGGAVKDDSGISETSAVHCPLALSLADPRLSQSDTGSYSGSMCRE